MKFVYVRPTGLWFFSRSIVDIARTLRRETSSVLLLVLLHVLVLPCLLVVLLPAHAVLDLLLAPLQLLAGLRVLPPSHGERPP